MKKYIVTLLLLISFILNVNASSFSLSVKCPSIANAGSIVSCTVTANPNDFSLKGLQINYSFSSGSYSDLVLANGFKSYSKNSNGAMLYIENYSTTSITVGTLKAVMPSSGSMTITFSNIIAGSSDNKDVEGSNVIKTIKVPSTINTLKSLSINNGTLTPEFSSSVTSYSATVSASSVVISASTTDSNATVSGTGTKSLKYGSNIFNVVVKSESGSTKTYKITITRPDDREKINTLSSLVVNNYSLTPAFSSSVTTYKLTVNANVTSVTIGAVKEGEKSSFVSGYGPRKVTLKYGTNTIEIKIKSESQSIKTYTIYITRQDDRSKNNYLSSLLVNDTKLTVNKSTTSYALTVKNEVEKIIISAEAADSKASISGTGTKALKVGINTFVVTVKAENESIRKYTIKVTRLTKENIVSSNNNLSNLTIENYSINFDPNVTIYNITIGDESELNFEYLAEDKTSTVVINGNE